MKNNKGFSLVELIIVIAIMAILVGVMAPQLIKYIEKANVSNDVQICDTVRTAVQTAMMDPAVIADTTYEDITGTNAAPETYAGVSAITGAAVSTVFEEDVAEALGCQSGDDLDSALSDQMKSSGAKDGTITIEVSATSVLVYITGTDMSGSKEAFNTPNSDPKQSCIYAGPITAFGY